MTNVTKQVHYRKFDPIVQNWTKGSMQKLIQSAFAWKNSRGEIVGERWELRTFPMPTEPALRRFSHGIIGTDESIFGVLCLYSPEDWTPVLKRQMAEAEAEHRTLEETLRQIEIAERPPADGEDYIRGIAYWMVTGDHFFVIQHTSIQTKAFEEYFLALFRSVGIMGQDEVFALQAVFNKAAAGGDLEDITSVQIGGVASRVEPRNLEPIAEGELKETVTEEQHQVARKVTRFEKARAVLEAIFSAPDAERILNAVPPEADLEVDVKFGYRSSKRKLSKAALADIASAARNLPDGEVIAFGKGGKQVGDDLRLSMSLPVKLVRDKGALLDLEDARLKLLRVYQRLMEDNKI